ncbi:hypothetical protein KCU95_g31, partial [Aureobasidium melanogenum]
LPLRRRPTSSNMQGKEVWTHTPCGVNSLGKSNQIEFEILSPKLDLITIMSQSETAVDPSNWRCMDAFIILVSARGTLPAGIRSSIRHLYPWVCFRTIDTSSSTGSIEERTHYPVCTHEEFSALESKERTSTTISSSRSIVLQEPAP